MGFTYDIAATHKDKHSSKCIMVCHLFESVIGVFASTFFVAHIFSLSIDVFDYIKNAGIYYFLRKHAQYPQTSGLSRSQEQMLHPFPWFRRMDSIPMTSLIPHSGIQTPDVRHSL